MSVDVPARRGEGGMGYYDSNEQKLERIDYKLHIILKKLDAIDNEIIKIWKVLG